MPDSKLSALTELATTPATTDEVYIRDVSEAAADQSKRITLANLLAAYNALVATLTNKTVGASQLTGIIADARMPDLTGDVTTVEGAVATTIGNDIVTNAKAANMAANTVKANATALSADPADLAVGANTVVGRVAGDMVAAALATAQIADDAVTYAKIQNVTTDRVIGRDTALSGDAEELTVGGGIEFTGTGGLQTSALTGDVTKAAGGTATTIAANAVLNTMLRDSGALSVIGRSANTTGDPADIAAVAAGDAVLRESGSTIGFGTVATAGIANDAVTNAKAANMAANTVKANATALSADPADLAVGANTVVGRVAGDIVAAQLATAQVADDAVTYAKMQNVSVTDRVLGRSTAGAGDVEEITMTAAGRALADDADAPAQRTTLGLGTMATVNSPVPIANGGTGETGATAAFNALDPLTTKGDIIVHNGTNSIRVAVGTNDQVLTADSVQASGVKWAAAGGAGALTRAGGNTTEATSTSTARVDLLSVSGLSIAAGAPIMLTIGARKTSGAAAAIGFGLKINATIVTEASPNNSNRVYGSSAVNRNEQGGSLIFVAPRVTNYQMNVAAIHINHIVLDQVVVNDLVPNDMVATNLVPNATVTDVIIRAQSDSALVTMGADEMHVYSYAVS